MGIVAHGTPYYRLGLYFMGIKYIVPQAYIAHANNCHFQKEKRAVCI